MLIVPELVIVWAGRQWYAAREIAGNHEEWTITHGFLASMGGFTLHEGGVASRTLDIDTLEGFYGEERIEWPTITEEVIEDRSKGDFLSKGMAVLQTTWFIVQCILRWVFGISLTQFELATFAFSALNIFLSVLWMKKPLAVAYPFQVHLRPQEPDPQEPDPQEPDPQEPGPLSPPLLNPPRSTFRRFLAPFNVASDLITCDTLPQVPNLLSVPTFYAPSSTNGIRATLIGLCVGISFGGIHCIAWNYEFPTPIELFIWRASAAATTAIPILFYLIVEDVRMALDDGFHDFSTLRISAVYISIGLYCISRAALVVLPILSLRRLPPEAFLEFKWSSFIPHI